MKNNVLGIIGGSGLYDFEHLEDIEKLTITTPFGKPSDKLIKGKLNGLPVVFLPRHGVGHRLMPSEVPVRANIYALKSVGVTKLLSISAVGSLKEELEPGDFLLPDQIFDRTKMRPSTFFGDGIVSHIGFDEPFCKDLRKLLFDIIQSKGKTVHNGGTYVCMEGPQFSTRAESHFYRSLGASVIGMTAIPEAKLAREAEICYALVAMVTDYDVWKEDERVTVDKVLSTVRKNVETGKEIIRGLANVVNLEPECSTGCAMALENSIMTDPETIPQKQKAKLQLLIEKYIK
ncbi:S-methyl-5'-thioadenosine phosphorylase [bacterium]|nr:S-methyl-5'-thioadenosine phosphorylase [bacterium]